MVGADGASSGAAAAGGTGAETGAGADGTGATCVGPGSGGGMVPAGVSCSRYVTRLQADTGISNTASIRQSSMVLFMFTTLMVLQAESPHHNMHIRF
jgi:hypothetical protein